jgi:prevent-host-death family protein
MTSMTATDFKARCLAVLDEVARTGESLMILKHGRPVAVLGPATAVTEKSPQESLAGTVDIVGDIVAPVLPPEAWDAVSAKIL